MKKVFRNFTYLLKVSYRDFGLLFWSLAYPIILITFFNIGFSGIMNREIGKINIGIEKGNPIGEILEGIDNIYIKEISFGDINKNLKEKKIDGFIDKELNIYINESGINQTIIKEIVDETKQMIYLNIPMENLDFNIDYIEGKNQEGNSILVIFYSLIAMVSTYGVFTGIEIASLVQGNLTELGARLNITPLKKSNFLISGFLVAFILNIFSNILLLLYVNYILKIQLFTELKYSLIFIILGNILGVSLGIFIGSSNKQSSTVKTMISVIATLFLSFLSGLMSPDIKNLLDKKIPIIGKINPISIITNNLYRINLLGNTKGIGIGIILLILYCLILLILSYLFLRRRNYDSL